VARRRPGIDRLQTRMSALFAAGLIGLSDRMGNPPAAEAGADTLASGLLIVAILLAGAAFLVYRWWDARRRASAGTGRAPRTTARSIPDAAGLVSPELDRWATGLLIATDERVRSLHRGLDGSGAGRTSEPTTSVTEVVATVDDELQRSFLIRRQVRVTSTEDDPARQARLREIVERLARAQVALDVASDRGLVPVMGVREREPAEEVDEPSRSDPAAETRLGEELAEADRDLRDLRSALAELGQLDVGVAGRVREVERALDRAHDAARQRPLDATAALRAATEARRLAASSLLVARETDDVRDRLLGAADATIRTASAEVERLAIVIDTSGRGIGDEPRAALGEARRELVLATGEVEADPAAAAEAAGRALRLVSDASLSAQEEIADWVDGGPGWGQRRGTPDGTATAEIIRDLLAR
jgi:hypothetical protein